MYRLAIEKEISASHQLRDYDGPCARLHGHNWKFRIEVVADHLDQSGIAIDFLDLDRLIWSVIGPFDHNHFNDFSPFDRLNPTAENIARHVFEKLEEQLPDGVTMNTVTLWENESCKVTYEPSDPR